MRSFLIYLLATLTLAGCADLRVYKVSNLDGYHDDRVKGFRYYLSRPYVVVKKSIIISDTVELRKMSEQEKKIVANKASASPGTIVAQKVTRQRGGTGITESVSEAEWATMRGLMEEGKVQLTGHHTPAPAPHVEVKMQIPQSTVLTNPNGGYDIVSSSSPSANDRLSTMDSGTAGTGGTAGLLGDTEAAPVAETGTAPLKGDIEIFFLPDLDEQYAVHNRNFLGKSSYDLQFKNGWELAGVNGEFNSTDVALELIKTIDTAINAATNLAANRISAGGGGGPSGMDVATSDKGLESLKGFENYMQVRKTTIIRPGIYRINKPWEMEGDGPTMGSGFLTQLGLDQITIVTHRVVTGEVLKQESIELNEIE